MKPPLLIRHHLGLGDHLICNGLVRVKAREHEAVFVPCKSHNFPSVDFMFSDLRNVHVIPVNGDKGAYEFCFSFSGEVLKLGMFGEGFSYKGWDKCFYEQAGVPFECRWDEFSYPTTHSEYTWRGPYIFIHDDTSRGFTIDSKKLPNGVTEVRPDRSRQSVFHWDLDIENAGEVHCIDSCFAIMADSLPRRKQELFLHLGCRADAKPPIYRKDWVVYQ